jgi:hypothetical protein
MLDNPPLVAALISLAFAWPAIITALIKWLQRGYTVVGLRILEPLLLLWSGLIVWWTSTQGFTFEGLPPHYLLPGAYVAFAALGLYAVGALASDIESFRAWREKVRAQRSGV